MSDVHQHFLRDFGLLIREDALASRADAVAASGNDRMFALGQNISYYAVVSLLLQQAAVIGLQPHDLGLDGIEPDRDLLAPGRAT